MKAHTKIRRSPERPMLWIGLVRLVGGLAFCLSAYLLWGSLTGDQLLGCGFASGCDAVMHSRWATFLGLPVSLAALGLYAAVLAATVVLRKSPSPVRQQQVWGFLLAASVAIIGAAIWFIALQLIVIGAICPFCMAAHTCGLILGALILANAPGSPAGQGIPGQEANRVQLAPSTVSISALAGLAAIIILSAGQIFYHPKTFAVQSLAPESSTNHTVQAAHRVFQLHGGAFALDLHEVPLLGSPDAPCVIVHLFDYSCRHCRQLHPLLLEVYHALSNQLAIVNLPVPLATNCNRLVKYVMPDHTNACAYAYTGLAVWRAKREIAPAFDDWVFSPLRPPSPEAVEAEAMRLVGTNEFNRARQDPWLKQQMDLDIRLYETNFVRYHKGALPELIIGTNLVSGVVRNAGDLFHLLTNQFNLRMP